MFGAHCPAASRSRRPSPLTSATATPTALRSARRPADHRAVAEPPVGRLLDASYERGRRAQERSGEAERPRPGALSARRPRRASLVPIARVRRASLAGAGIHATLTSRKFGPALTVLAERTRARGGTVGADVARSADHRTISVAGAAGRRDGTAEAGAIGAAVVGNAVVVRRVRAFVARRARLAAEAAALARLVLAAADTGAIRSLLVRIAVITLDIDTDQARRARNASDAATVPGSGQGGEIATQTPLRHCPSAHA